MDEIEIIADGIKALYNTASEQISKGRYDEAEEVFNTIERTVEVLGYKEGIGMVRVSLANLSMMRGNILDALTHMEVAKENYSPGENMRAACDTQTKISLIALEIGMKKENDGDLEGALELFEKILPNLNEKRAAAVAGEIENIKRYLEGNAQ